MTLDRKPLQNYRLLEPCECVDLCDLGEVPLFYNPIEPEIQSKPCPVQRPKSRPGRSCRTEESTGTFVQNVLCAFLLIAVKKLKVESTSIHYFFPLLDTEYLV
jgi:hypothetical protein